MASLRTSLINGSFDQTISAVDRGFSYGDGVFRTMKIKGGQPISWPFHYQKLVADCAAIGIVCPSAELLMSDMQQLFPINEFDDEQVQVVKIIITRGEGERGYAPPAVTIPTRVLIKSNMPSYADAHYTQGVRLHICDTRLALQPKLAGIKHLNRLENVLARMEWRDESVFDGLMLDQNDHVIECTMSNIFARVGQTLYTPDLSQCGVAGITRQHILGLENLLGLTAHVATISLQELLNADEVIICNSLYGAFQVAAIGDQTWKQQSLASTIRNILTHG
ncbi:aminodeoxychorismate lyase [Methylotenera mobilis]|uniref:aminodeoxychorismate lyase n=1 Tax=Methylotenera mobilis (strain JLW8 / ATCC BAA-1282 / DSM 17540) TaxID=583345 RepID=C6WVU7_METML|nr:aminodeoxychorismate lyase [Methylotenera mobilis]ACT48046.1 aminodeoxychorismate lyase [Methylotenera mobilis JLW8]